jgi:hypothetical protein
MASRKEGWLRDWILKAIEHRELRAWCGKVPGRKDLGDIDLAIIDDANKACLLCELKWFISPSDPREWLEKGEEVRKGISQALALRNAFAEGCAPLKDCLGITDRYRFSTAVATPGWIGQSTLQDDGVAVLGAAHLTAELVAANLPTTLDWLESRAYLPVAGRDFSIVSRIFTVGPWKLEWYQIQPLIGELFRPVDGPT